MFFSTKKTQVSEVIFCGIPQKFRLTWICVVGDIFYGSYQGEITPLNPPFGEDVFTLPESNSSPLKMDGWNTTFLLGFGLFSGALAVSFREFFFCRHQTSKSKLKIYKLTAVMVSRCRTTGRSGCWQDNWQ